MPEAVKYNNGEKQFGLLLSERILSIAETHQFDQDLRPYNWIDVASEIYGISRVYSIVKRNIRGKYPDLPTLEKFIETYYRPSYLVSDHLAILLYLNFENLIAGDLVSLKKIRKAYPLGKENKGKYYAILGLPALVIRPRSKSINIPRNEEFGFATYGGKNTVVLSLDNFRNNNVGR